jgi:ABC-type glycerol-3-phosphate transport system substrate-binding protein
MPVAPAPIEVQMSIRRTLFLPAILSIVLAACSTGTGSSATTSTTTASSSPATTASASSSAPSSSDTASAKVSANNASESELVAALSAAGVQNADRWAREVMEYRPYPTDDASLQKLQDNLAKYNPDAPTLAAILAALEP